MQILHFLFVLWYDVSMSIYGGIRYKAVDHDVPARLNSGVSLPEAVKIWIDSLSEASRAGKLASKRWYSGEGRFYLEVIDVRLV